MGLPSELQELGGISMFLLAAVGGFHIGDMIFQLFSFLFGIALVVGIVSLIVMVNKRNKRLDRMEEKLEQLESDKEE